MASSQDPKLATTTTGTSNTSGVVPTSAGLKDTGVVTHNGTQVVTNKKPSAERDSNLDETPRWKKV